MKETILLFNITDQQTRRKLERIFLPLKMRIRYISTSQYHQTLSVLCGLEEPNNQPAAFPPETTPTFEDPMMIFAGLSDQKLDLVLTALRAQKIFIPYKGILTPTNCAWTPVQCFVELKKEHEQMHHLQS